MKDLSLSDIGTKPPGMISVLAIFVAILLGFILIHPQSSS